MEKYDIPIYIIPCGLNYFSGHRFRGSVLVEYGEPYQIPTEYVELYREDRRKSCGSLLNDIREHLTSVILKSI